MADGGLELSGGLGELVLPGATADEPADHAELQKRVLAAVDLTVKLAEEELARLVSDAELAKAQGASWSGGTRLRLVTPGAEDCVGDAGHARPEGEAAVSGGCSAACVASVETMLQVNRSRQRWLAAAYTWQATDWQAHPRPGSGFHAHPRVLLAGGPIRTPPPHPRVGERMSDAIPFVLRRRPCPFCADRVAELVAALEECRGFAQDACSEDGDEIVALVDKVLADGRRT